MSNEDQNAARLYRIQYNQNTPSPYSTRRNVESWEYGLDKVEQDRNKTTAQDFIDLVARFSKRVASFSKEERQGLEAEYRQRKGDQSLNSKEVVELYMKIMDEREVKAEEMKPGPLTSDIKFNNVLRATVDEQNNVHFEKE